MLANASALVASRLVAAVLGWTGTVLVVRSLSVDDFGRFTFIFSVLGLMSVVTELGVGRVAVGGMLEGPDPGRFAGSYVLLRTALGVVGYLLAVGFVAAAGHPATLVAATAVAGIVVLLATPERAYETVFQAHRRLRPVAVTRIVAQLAQLGLTAAIATAGGSLLWFTVPAVVAELVALACVVAAVRRLVVIRYRADLAGWWALLREAAPLAVGGVLATVYFRVDLVMLSLLDTFTAVARYGVAYKFVDIVHFVSTAVTVATLPLLVASWPDRIAEYRATVRRAGTVLALAAGMVAVQFVLFAEPVIAVLYGTDYVPAAPAARLVVVSECLTFGTALALITLIAAGRHRRYPIIALAGLVLNVALNLVLIPRYSFVGSAAATLATDVVVLVWMWSEVRRVEGLVPLPKPPLIRIGVTVVIAATVGAAVATLLPWPVAVVVVLGTYTSAAVASRAGGPSGLRDLLRDTIEPSKDAPGPAPLRLLAISHCAAVSGAERVLLNHLTAARLRGWTVHCLTPAGALAGELRSAGIPHSVIPDLKLPGGPRAIALGRLIGRWLLVARRLRTKTRGHDLVLANGLLALPALCLAPVRPPVCWLVHDVIVHRGRSLLLRMCAPAVTRAVAVSCAAAAPVRACGVATTVVRNGVPWPVQPAGPPTRPAVVGISAMLTSWKGQDVLLEAAGRLDGDIVVEVMGGRFPKDGRYVERLQARAGRRDLAGQVRFLGHQDDPLARMRTWTVAVNASTNPEACPLAVLEAMSLGLPVVATDHGGSVEVLGDGGLLVPPGDPAALADAIARLLDDAELRERCGAAGRAAIAAGMSERERTDDVLDLLEEEAR